MKDCCFLNWIHQNRYTPVVHLNFRTGSTFPVPLCTVPSMERTSRCNKVDAVRLYASYRMNLLLLKGRGVWYKVCLKKQNNSQYFLCIRLLFNLIIMIFKSLKDIENKIPDLVNPVLNKCSLSPGDGIIFACLSVCHLSR